MKRLRTHRKSAAAILLGLSLAAPALANSDRQPVFAGAQWFNDFEELGEKWVALRENPGLPDHKRHFCAQAKANAISERLTGGDISKLFGGGSDAIYQDDNQPLTLSFRNPPGTFNTGLCWMHSRFQRAATYLANYRPNLAKPTHAQAGKIIARIASRNGVVEIPGYKDLWTFSHAYRNEIISLLDRQGVKCFFDPTDCAARIPDSYHPRPRDLQLVMHTLYDRMVNAPGDIQEVRIRASAFEHIGFAKPFASHALLVLSMQPIIGATGDRDDPAMKVADETVASGSHELPSPLRGTRQLGYVLVVLDSNDPNVLHRAYYYFGDDHVSAPASNLQYTFAPYIHEKYDGDLASLHRAIDAYCRSR